ncbi:FG-GAP and VCBS repeat-containing protein [Streptomyces katsurahamanus]|uniref:Integrin-like protein n=1 Tax=Streptomyces katsurahamanus TaxID=2577098 RepID=A0ABW9NPU2_9ACTN|nr:FG-GAP and VCBS repeat-containing protein [Streptomyces katsurahamanus]MQS35298.1 integrin-like protein [Streptomyces katsurahamanus]
MSLRADLRLALATAVTVSLTGGLLGLTTGTATAAAPAKAAAKPAKPAKHSADYNGDGYRDYATPNSVNGVVVTYGTATGPGTERFTFGQGSPGIPGEDRGDGDSFASALASADFNGDGYADLAVSDPGEKVGKHSARGMVVIVWGSKTGLGSKATTVNPTSSAPGQYYGKHLAAGDFSGDGKPDLAVSDNRSVHVHRGGFSSKTGATGKVSRFIAPKADLRNPLGLAAGKVTKDKVTDLYVFVAPEKTDPNKNYRWGTWFLKGGSTIKPGRPTTNSAITPSHAWGKSGVVADFDKDGYGDLAFTDPYYKKYAGSVLVVRGGKNGPVDHYRLTQNTPGIATIVTAHDHFGSSISAGDTNRDGYPDLAVGTEETVGDVSSAGGAHVLYGGKKGLTGKNSLFFTRETAGFPGDAREYERFGSGVRLTDADHDGYADLLVSSRDESGVYDGHLLGGGEGGITTEKVSKVPVTPNFPQ